MPGRCVRDEGLPRIGVEITSAEEPRSEAVMLQLFAMPSWGHEDIQNGGEKWVILPRRKELREMVVVAKRRGEESKK